MKKWMLKALAQGLISLLPNNQRINYIFQRSFTGSLKLTRPKLLVRFRWAQQHINYFREFGTCSIEEAAVLELGTGWFPIVPLTLFLAGFNKIYTIDVKNLFIEEYFREVLVEIAKIPFEFLKQEIPAIRDDRFLVFREIVVNSAKMTIPEILSALEIIYIVGDASKTEFPNTSFDLIVSNTTLEHIPYDILLSIFREFHRISHPQGVHSHLIDMNDHYTYFDQTITIYNFLKYSKQQWQRFNNSIHYQNRCRLSDYRRMFNDSGFTIVYEKVYNSNASLLNQVALHNEYAGYTFDDLSAHGLWCILKSGSQ